MTAPMHKHRTRTNGVSLKMRLAASKNVRTRNVDGMKISLCRAPWEKPSKKQKGENHV